jgi:hypothetical protein
VIIPIAVQSLSSLYAILLEEGAIYDGDDPAYAILDRILRGEMIEGSWYDDWKLSNWL